MNDLVIKETVVIPIIARLVVRLGQLYLAPVRLVCHDLSTIGASDGAIEMIAPANGVGPMTAAEASCVATRLDRYSITTGYGAFCVVATRAGKGPFTSR